jgi:hypothetical protein
VERGRSLSQSGRSSQVDIDRAFPWDAVLTVVSGRLKALGLRVNPALYVVSRRSRSDVPKQWRRGGRREEHRLVRGCFVWRSHEAHGAPGPRHKRLTAIP